MQEHPDESGSRKAAAALAFLAAPLLFLLQGGGGGFFTDEGSLLLAGHHIANGVHLYTDLVNEKPPTLFLFSSLFMRENPLLHLVWYRLAVALAAGSAAAFAAWRYSAHDRFWRGFLTGLAVVLAFAQFAGFKWSPNSFIALAAFYLPFLLPEGAGRWNWFRAGLLSGVLLTTRFQNLPLVLAAAACAAPGSVRHGRLRWFSAGFAAFLLTIAVYLSATGTLRAAFTVTVLENLRNASGLSTYAFAATSPVSIGLVTVLGLVIFFLGLPHRRRNETLLLLLVLYGGAMLSTLPRMDHLRFLAAAVLGILAFAELAPEQPRGYRPLALAGLFAAAVIVAQQLPHVYGKLERDRTAVFQAAMEIEDADLHGDRLFVFPAEPYLYLAAGRPPASRRYFVNPWRSSPEMQKEIADDLTAAGYPPIADTWGFVPVGHPVEPAQYAQDFLAFRAMRYRHARTLPSGIEIWIYSERARERR